MRPSRLLIAAAATGLVITMGTTGLAAADDTDTNTVEVPVAGGELNISVASGTSNLGTVENTPNGIKVSGQLGEVTVRDDRNGPDGSSWVATVVATDLEPRKGSGIAPSKIRYDTGPVQQQGTVTVRASKPVNLNRPRPVVTASEISGNNKASWTPTITITIPPEVVAGTYSGTITHSVL